MAEIETYKLLLKNQELILSADKAIFWKQQESLIISDIHLGKSGHFRKAGIAIPETLNNNNLTRISRLLNQFNPKKILFLGDLFHSQKNSEWNTFDIWRKSNANIEMHLVIGNHDFYDIDEYNKLGLICSNALHISPFNLIHDLNDLKNQSNFVLSGHVHPAVQLKGKGKQSIKIPCFYFGENYAILPAFGSFTGTHLIKPRTNEQVFGIVENQIIRIS